MSNGVTKVNKEEFLARVTTRLQEASSSGADSGAKQKDFSVPEVCDAMLAEIEHIVGSGGRLSLTGFGSFYAQMHKGHPVQFGGTVKKVHDYPVFKFSASNVLNKKLRTI